MKLIAIEAGGVIRELDATDGLIPAAALAAARHHDTYPDHSLANALRAALEACAVLAATDTLRDNQTPEAGMLEDTRRVWGPFDTSGRGKPRITRRPQ